MFCSVGSLPGGGGWGVCFVLFTVDVLGFDFFFLPGGCGWICFVLCLADGCGCWCLFVFFLGSVVWRSVVLGLFVLPGGCGWVCLVPCLADRCGV